MRKWVDRNENGYEGRSTIISALVLWHLECDTYVIDWISKWMPQACCFNEARFNCFGACLLPCDSSMFTTGRRPTDSMPVFYQGQSLFSQLVNSSLGHILSTHDGSKIYFFWKVVCRLNCLFIISLLILCNPIRDVKMLNETPRKLMTSVRVCHISEDIWFYSF